MDLIFSEDDIARYRDTEEILRKTIEQIKKDFIPFGMEIEFPDNLKLAYFTLFDQLLGFIKQLMHDKTEILYSLLYRIDLHENKIKQEVNKNRDKSLEEIITHLILNRELQKVLTREYYSGRL